MQPNTFTPSLGVIFHPRFPPNTLADYARRAEAAGFDALWLWDDCFLPGAFTAAAIALSATQHIKVGIGLLPIKVYNPLFAAMEITTLASAFPGRFMPGFGYGVESWMAQIGSAPRSSIQALRETVVTVRRLLQGEQVTIHSEHLNLEKVQMNSTPANVPPLYIGGMREKTLQLAGEVGDGAILTSMSSPTYVRWAAEHFQAGRDAAHSDQPRKLVVYVDVSVDPDGEAARQTARKVLAQRLPWSSSHTQPLGITQEAAALAEAYPVGGAAQQIPDAWLDALTCSGTPQQVSAGLQRLAQAGADMLVLQPLDGDKDCLDDYIQYLMPLLKPAV